MIEDQPLFPRASGVLLHPTCLPGPYGIGDLGEIAFQFVDWLREANQTIWQMLPLGPTSYGDSPYQCLSSFAGNPLLISFDRLVEEDWLTEDDLADTPDFNPYLVEFGEVITYHDRILSLAYDRFEGSGTLAQRIAFNDWCAQNAYWLEDFVLFVALKNTHGGQPWVEWPKGEALRDPDMLEKARSKHARPVAEQRFRQWVFHRQWYALKDYATENGIRLIGDIPIFVAHDSADVWANRELFFLDEAGSPTVVAGVPPDYFSPTGQRWGNPLYNWDKMAQDSYSWWISRFRAALALVDVVRLDHFRGFEAYWEVPASEPTATIGRWVDGPGFKFLHALRDALGKLPIIAEDLGVITPGVEALRDELGLPGMRILQFAFGGEGGENRFLPHHHGENSVVYSGTHDNNTSLGWWQTGEADEDVREFLTDYVGHEIREPHWDLIRLGMMSVAHTFIAPMQDVLGFGADTRMNTPGVEPGPGVHNWQWRFTAEWLANPAKERLARLAQVFGRAPHVEEEDEEAEEAQPV